MKATGSLGPKGIVAVVRELRTAADERPLVVSGAKGLVPLLARELRAGGDASAVVEDGAGARSAVLVYVLGGHPEPEDLAVLRAADRDEVPVVCVARPEAEEVPYVLTTDLVHVQPGGSFPLDEIADAVARKLGERGSGLARRLPVIRRAVCNELIRSYARKNGLIGAAVFVPGVDLPVLTLNQIRLVLRIGQAYGHELDRERALEILPVIAGGFGLRALARELLDLVPVAGWLLKGAVAYAGTRAVGEAAVLYFEAGGATALKE
jgi:uncharacterized protein (DUF697 family)